VRAVPEEVHRVGDEDGEHRRREELEHRLHGDRVRVKVRVRVRMRVSVGASVSVSVSVRDRVRVRVRVSSSSIACTVMGISNGVKRMLCSSALVNARRLMNWAVITKMMHAYTTPAVYAGLWSIASLAIRKSTPMYVTRLSTTMDAISMRDEISEAPR